MPDDHTSTPAYAGTMTTVNIPGTDLHVSDIVFGTNIFGWSIHDQSEANRLLDTVVDAGINFLDSADQYVQWHPGGVGGESETTLGSWLATSGKRDQVVIATKVGKMTARPGLSRDNIIAAADDSLKRLGTDHIDLYYAHFDDLDTPLEETLQALHELVAAGKVLSLGASNYSAKRLHEAHRIVEANSLTPYVAIQNEYNLVARDHYESDSVPAIDELGLVGFPFFSLASGFLTGKYRPGITHDSVRSGRVASGYANEENQKTLERLLAVSEKHGAEPASVAIEWLRRRPGVHAPIASARNADQLATLLTRVELTDEDMSILSG